MVLNWKNYTGKLTVTHVCKHYVIILDGISLKYILFVITCEQMYEHVSSYL